MIGASNVFFDEINHLVFQTQIPAWGPWSYLALALLVAVEGPVATLLGAAAASAGVMRSDLVFLAAAAGNLTADSIWYLLGYAGKIEWLFRFSQRLGINRRHLEHLEKLMQTHSIRVLFFAKLSMSLMVPSLLAAGLIRVPWRRWFPAVFGGELIWTGALVLIGYYATEAIKQIEQGLEYLFLFGAIAFVVFIIALSRRMLRDSRAQPEDSTPWAKE